MASSPLALPAMCQFRGKFRWNSSISIHSSRAIYILKQLTGHSSVDGTFAISGALRQANSFQVDANITRATLNYEFVQLENEGPLRLSYKRNEVTVEQMHLHGADTDLQLGGSVRFDGNRPMNFTLAGSVDLRLLKGMMPDLTEQGRADLNVAMKGTMSQPQITGRASVHDASASYADFPIGLSHVNGDIVFDTSRLLLNNVTAEAGGGKLVADRKRELRRRAAAVFDHGGHAYDSNPLSRRDELAHGRNVATFGNHGCGCAKWKYSGAAAAVCRRRGRGFILRNVIGEFRRFGPELAVYEKSYIRHRRADDSGRANSMGRCAG